MKWNLVLLAFVRAAVVPVFAFVVVMQVHAQGSIVPNGVSFVSYNPELGIVIHVLQNPTNGDFTGLSLAPQGGDSFVYDPFTVYGLRTFLVSPNDPITLQPILANSYTELQFLRGYTFAQGSVFYFGFYTGDTAPQNGIYSDPLFGWGEFTNNGGVIQLLDSGLEYGGGGVYAGTQNIISVPEPSVVSLLFSGILLFGWRFKRARTSRERINGHSLADSGTGRAIGG